MRCCLVFFPNSLQIHLDRELTKEYAVRFHSQACSCLVDKNRQNFISELLSLDGIDSLFIDRYIIYIKKGRVFEWDELIGSIMLAVLIGLDPLGELKQVKPAVEHVPQNLIAQENESAENAQYTVREKKLKIPNPYRLPEKERKKPPK